MTVDRSEPHERELRDLLVGVVPPLVAPADRWDRVAARVTRRRRARAAVAGLGTVLALIVGGLLVEQPRPAPAGLTVGADPAPDGSGRSGPDAAASTAGGPGRTGATSAPGATGGPAAAPRTSAPAGTRPGTGGPAGGSAGIDLSRIPQGEPGSARRRIVDTAERPVPGDGTGIFRTVCGYAGMRAEDPLRRPGRANAVPLNVFWGNGSVDAGSTAESVAGGGASTCRGGVVDRSAYWTAALYDPATGSPMAPGTAQVYFSSGYAGVLPADVRALPAGLRITLDTATARARPEWVCQGTGRRSAEIPSCPGGDVLEQSIVFPQCWDGVHLDAPDHHSHVAYPAGNGCPASHPVALPEISYHLLYPVPRGVDPRRWRLSSDPPAGAGGRAVTAGWINGWDAAIAETWARSCIRAAVSCGSHLIGDGRALEGDH